MKSLRGKIAIMAADYREQKEIQHELMSTPVMQVPELWRRATKMYYLAPPAEQKRRRTIIKKTLAAGAVALVAAGWLWFSLLERML